MILVYGGSFDPVHRGHVAVLSAARKFLHNPITYVVPAFNSPGKPKHKASIAHRLELCELSFPFDVTVSHLESSMGERMYTCDIMEYFARQYPKDEICFLMGSDCLAGFNSWKNAMSMSINPRFRFAVHKRTRYPLVLSTYIGTDFDAIPGKPFRWSSTQIRGVLAKGVMATGIPKDTFNYMRKHRLYGATL